VHLIQMPMADTALEDEESAREFARQAGLGLATLTCSDIAEGNLTLPLALSAWLRITRIGVVGACSSLLGLRAALLEASGLDRDTEPVPLLTRDPQRALIGHATYVRGLIFRSAAHADRPTSALVEEALELLA